jgi:hypothetical protein
VLPLSNVLPLLGRALNVLAGREHEPLLGLVKSTMVQLDSTFTERDYGVSSFLDFAKKLAADGLIRLDRQNGNYLIGGMEGEQIAPKESREDTALNVLREVLQEAAQRGRREFHIHGLKQFVSKLRPGFDERKYGFKQFSALMNLAHDRGLVSIAPDERGAMRVRTILEQTPPAESPGEAAETAAATMDDPSADITGMETRAEDASTAFDSEPQPFEAASGEHAAPAKRRRKPSGSSGRSRTPRKKKAPTPAS